MLFLISVCRRRHSRETADQQCEIKDQENNKNTQTWRGGRMKSEVEADNVNQGEGMSQVVLLQRDFLTPVKPGLFL